MNYREESEHIELAFRYRNQNSKLKLVAMLRDEAIKHLEPVKDKVPRDFSGLITEKYKDAGVSLVWDLTTTDAYTFCSMVDRNDNISLTQKNAAKLLYLCTVVLEEGQLCETRQKQIVGTYASLDDESTNKGINHSKAQSDKAKRPRGKIGDNGLTINEIVKDLVRLHENETASEMWPHLYAKLDELDAEPEEINKTIKYCNSNGDPKTITFKTFCNMISKHKSH